MSSTIGSKRLTVPKEVSGRPSTSSTTTAPPAPRTSSRPKDVTIHPPADERPQTEPVIRRTTVKSQVIPTAAKSSVPVNRVSAKGNGVAPPTTTITQAPPRSGSAERREVTPVPENAPPKPTLQKFVRSASAPRVATVSATKVLSVADRPRLNTPRLRGYVRSKSLNAKDSIGNSGKAAVKISSTAEREAELEVIRKQVCQLVVKASTLVPQGGDSRPSLDAGWRMLLEQSHKRERFLEQSLTKMKVEHDGTQEVRKGLFSVNYEMHEAEMQRKIDKMLAEKDALLLETQRETAELKLLVEGLKRENEKLHKAVVMAGVEVPALHDTVCIHTPHIERPAAQASPSPTRT